MTEMRPFSPNQNVCFAGQLIERQNIATLDQNESFLHFVIMSNLSIDNLVRRSKKTQLVLFAQIVF